MLWGGGCQAGAAGVSPHGAARGHRQLRPDVAAVGRGDGAVPAGAGGPLAGPVRGGLPPRRLPRRLSRPRLYWWACHGITTSGLHSAFHIINAGEVEFSTHGVSCRLSQPRLHGWASLKALCMNEFHAYRMLCPKLTTSPSLRHFI